MTKIDQFESAFRAADKPQYQHEDVPYKNILLVTDLDESGAADLGRQVRSFLAAVDKGGSLTWRNVAGKEYSTIGDLLQLVDAEKPDLIATYRDLHTEGWRWPGSLGSYLDVLTQLTPYPVLVLPHPKAEEAAPHALADTDSVVALTDHLAGDDHLVHHAAALTQAGGRLFLTHVEDEQTYDRYIATIAKIPDLDTETASSTIKEQLLREPAEYVESCRRGLAAANVNVEVESVIRLGHNLEDHLKLVVEHETDLLVLNTKDDDQEAMHGLAHPLAIQLRQIPLLML